MKNKWLCVFLSMLLCCFCLCGCGGNAENSGDSGSAGNSGGTLNSAKVINIGTMDLVNGDLIARKENYYEELLGIEVKILNFASGKDVNTALASGSIDVSELGTSPAAIAIASGLDISVIGIGDIIGSAESLVVKKDRGIEDVSGLKGMKIATPFASTAHFSLLNALKLSGVNEADVTLLDMEADDIYAAWQRGDIDGAYIWYPVLDKLISDGGTVITGGDKLTKEGVITGDLLVARNEFAKANPEIVSKYLKAILKANDVYFKDPETACKDVAEILMISEEDAKNQLSQFTYLNAEEQLSKEYMGGGLSQILKNSADFLYEQKSISKSPELQEFENRIDSSYLEAAVTY